VENLEYLWISDFDLFDYTSWNRAKKNPSEESALRVVGY
jgi:hypothetical protein